jgi:hypothetical protein
VRGLEDAIRAASPEVADAVTRLLHLSRDPELSSTMTRAMSAVADLAGSIDDDGVAVVSGAASDAEVLARLLEQPSALAKLSAGDPLADARLRWVHDRQRLLTSNGEPLTARAVCDLLGVTRQAVAKARHDRRLVGVPNGRGSYLYPSWQFGPSGPLHGLRDLSHLLDDDPWTLITFMLAPNPRLGDKTPLHALRGGQVSEVLRAAQAYREHGAA